MNTITIQMVLSGDGKATTRIVSEHRACPVGACPCFDQLVNVARNMDSAFHALYSAKMKGSSSVTLLGG